MKLRDSNFGLICWSEKIVGVNEGCCEVETEFLKVIEAFRGD
jgi:hypothetical protein